MSKRNILLNIYSIFKLSVILVCILCIVVLEIGIEIRRFKLYVKLGDVWICNVMKLIYF